MKGVIKVQIENSVIVHRGDIIESKHEVHIAVVDYKGNLLKFTGDVSNEVYARSSMKPIQAIPIVETGAADTYEFSDTDLSLCTASHNGEPMHTNRVLSMLKRGGMDDSYLRCGTHNPRWEPTFKELIVNGKEITPLYNNCSGKHSGMLATAKKMGESTEDYYLANHPVQQRILKVVSEMCEYPIDDIEIGIDGCGVPVHGLPLKNIALGYARLVRPEGLGGKREEAIKRITKAMTTAPEMVGGTERFCTDFMKAGKGRFIGKAGAEGVYCIGDFETGIGIAIKVADGNIRAAYPAAMEVLVQLGLLTEEHYEPIKEYHRPKLLNTRNEVIGELVPTFQLSNFENLVNT